MLLCGLDLPIRAQQVRNISMSLVVFGIQLQSSRQLRVSMLPVLHLHIGLAQLIVGFGVSAIHQGRIAQLDDGFAVSAFVEVALSALEIFLLTDVGVARACREQRGHTCDDGNNTNQRRRLHYNSPRGAGAPDHAKF